MRSTFSSGHLDVDLHERFIDDILKLGNTRLWDFTGGEPTLHPHLDVLIQAYIKRNIKVNIMTNAQLESGYETVIKNKQGIRFVRVSFDSPIKEYNDSVRGPGTFDAACKGVEAYVKNGVRVVLGFVVHEENIDLIEECFKLGMRLGASNVAIWGNQQWVAGAESDNRNKSLKWGESIKWNKSTSERYHAQLALVNKYKPFIDGTVSTKFNKENIVKPQGWSCQNYSYKNNIPTEERIVLLPDGLVSQCCDLYDVDYDYGKFPKNPHNEDPVSHILGDYKTDTLEKILLTKKERFAELEKRLKRDYELGLLKDERQNMCTTCAYYHYEPKNKLNSRLVISYFGI